MNQLALTNSSSGRRCAALSGPTAMGALSVLFFAVLALAWLRLWLAPGLFPNTRWPECLLTVLGATIPMVSLGRQLPRQNVALAGSVIGFFAAAMQRISSTTAQAIGPGIILPTTDRSWHYARATLVCVLWIAVILNSRATAQLMLRPWRCHRAYGLWLLALAAGLAVEMQLSIGPVAASHANRALAQNPVASAWPWCPTGWTGVAAWTVTAALILALIAPALISKSGVRVHANYHAPGIWCGPNCLFVTAAAAHGSWGIASAFAAMSLAVVGLAVSSARKRAKYPDDENRPSQFAPVA